MIPAGQRLLRLGGCSLLWRPRTLAVGAVLLVVAGALALALLGMGTIRLTPDRVLAGLMGSEDDGMATRIVRLLRLPRLLTAAIVGASLGAAGAAFQSISRNALGSPDVIGFTTGAATGAITGIVLFQTGPTETALAAVGAGLLTAFTVLALARQRGAGGGYRLILIGIGCGAVLTGVNTMLMVKGGIDQAMAAQIWLAGSLTGRSWSHVGPAFVAMLLLLPVLVVNARRLALLEMGTDIATGLGIHVGRTRMVAVLAAVGLTSVATASTGPIAFIALAGPQIARRLTRAPEVPILTGALTGAVLLLAADLLGQVAPFRLTLPIGLTTGLLGGLYLMVVLLQRDR
ncbi:FecCD family ABC transporter permease [Chachezhania sediminis]|uniref:FecCD family ABC transporter permease n=1 Tax=Chachezhania sediminis TaxID=2599291 RepID=UPI001E402FAA|nr:iron chelate uptake ABC transporter family permease subunit [Chachezhania sediminis]